MGIFLFLSSRHCQGYPFSSCKEFSGFLYPSAVDCQGFSFSLQQGIVRFFLFPSARECQSFHFLHQGTSGFPFFLHKGIVKVFLFISARDCQSFTFSQLKRGRKCAGRSDFVLKSTLKHFQIEYRANLSLYQMGIFLCRCVPHPLTLPLSLPSPGFPTYLSQKGEFPMYVAMAQSPLDKFL
jgi:hypothetical protein